MKILNSNNNKGFSLVEIMVAAGMLGVLSLALMRIMGTSMQVSKDASQKAERTQVGYLFSTTLRNKIACERTFAGADGLQPAANPSGAGSTVNSVWNARSGTPVAIINEGQVFGRGTDGMVTVDSISIHSFSEPDGVVGPATATIVLDRGQMAETNQDLVIDVILNVVTNGGNVETCFTNEDEYVESACVALGGQVDDSSPPDAGKCKNLVITNNSSLDDDSEHAGSSAYAMQALGPVRIYGPELNDGTAQAGTGGVIISSVADLADPPGEGNLLVTGTTEVLQDAMVRRSMVVGSAIDPSGDVGDLDIETDFTAGGNADIQGDTNVEGNTFVRGGVLVGASTTAPDASSLKVEGAIGVGTDAPALSPGGRYHGAGSLKLGTSFSGGTQALVDSSFNSGRPNMIVRGNVVILSEEQGTETDYSDNEPRHAATVGWVRSRIAKTLSPQAGNVGDIVGDILLNSSSGEDAAYEVIKNYVCGRMRVRNKDGSFPAPVVDGAGYCVLDTPDTRCDESGVCDEVQANTGMTLNGDRITEWPKNCSETGECDRLCIDGVCKDDWGVEARVGSCSWSYAGTAGTTTFDVRSAPGTGNSGPAYRSHNAGLVCGNNPSNGNPRVMAGWRTISAVKISSGLHSGVGQFQILCCNVTTEWPNAP